MFKWFFFLLKLKHSHNNNVVEFFFLQDARHFVLAVPNNVLMETITLNKLKNKSEQKCIYILIGKC